MDLIKDNILKKFGQVIVEKRHQIGISQEDLAYDSGLARSFVSEIERGIKQPTLTTLFQLASSLETSASKIVTELEKKMKE